MEENKKNKEIDIEDDEVIRLFLPDLFSGR
jgi:hypothetical protein